MMKKIVIFFSFALLCNTTYAQIELTTSLLDSLIANLYTFNQPQDILNDRLALNFATQKTDRNSMYVSATAIMMRENIHENMMICINEKDLFFVILRKVKVDSRFRSRLIEYNDPRFERILDSIKFGAGPFYGMVIMRSPLKVYRIKKRPLCKNSYVITSKNYIPYLSAPEAFIPIKKFAYGGESDKIEPWYYDAFGKLNKQYYEDIKPGKKIILKMPKEK